MASKQQYTLELLLGARTDQSYDSSIHKAEKGITGISSSAKKAAALITSAFAAVNVTGFAGDAVKEYADFEQELTNTSATMGASVTEYEQMEKAARQAGMATTKTASESAAALGYMALAGWDVEESTSALMPVLKLSEATNLDLARTSDLVTDSMGALKLEVADLPQYLDLVTKGQNSSNQTAEQMMEGYIRAGGAARSLGIDAKDTGIALGILANNGTKASEGGRSINAMLTRMAANGEAIKAMKEIGVSIFDDAKGEFVGLEESLKRINKGMSSLNMKEQAQTLKSIAGTNYYTKMKYLLDSVKDGADGSASAWSDLDNKLSHADGTLEGMSKKITSTMSGSVKIMQSALSDAKISFGDAVKGEVVEVIHDFTGMFNAASEKISDFAENNEIKIYQTFEGIKDTVYGAGNIIGSITGSIVNNFGAVQSAIAGVGGALAAEKVVNGIKSFSVAVKGLDDIGRGGFIAGGVMLVAGAAAAVGTHAYNAHKKLVQADLEGHFGNISLSLEDIDGTAQKIVGKKKLARISELFESIGNTDEAVNNMADSMKSINRITWKAKAGFKLETDDLDTYKAEIENYVKSAQDIADSQGYSVSVATKLLFGKNSEKSKVNDAFYAGIDAELSGLESKLNKKIKKAVENGVDIKTDQAIQKLLGKINTITTAITEAEDEAGWQQLETKYSGKDLTADTFKQLSKDVQKYTEEANQGIDEAYNTTLTNANAQRNIKLSDLKEKLDNKDITRKQYQKKVAKAESRHETDIEEATQAYHEKKAQTMLKSSGYLVNSIKGAYPEAEKAFNNLSKSLKSGLDEALEQGVNSHELNGTLEGILDSSMESMGLSSGTQGAITELFKSGLGNIWSDMQDYADELQKAGMEVPKSLAKGINDIEALSAISGSAEDAMEYFGETIGSSDKWTAAVNACVETGGTMPEGIAEGMNNKSIVVEEAAGKLAKLIESSQGMVQASNSTAAFAIGEADGSNSIQMPSFEWAQPSSDAISNLFKDSIEVIRDGREQMVTEAQVAATGMIEAVATGLNDAGALNNVTASADEAVSFTRNATAGNVQWADITSTCNEKGAGIPRSIAGGINDNKSAVISAATNLMGGLESSLNKTITTHVQLNVAGGGGTASTSPGSGTSSPGNTGTGKKGKLAKNARGGIYSNPVLSILAEEGREAVIPLDSSSRAKALWRNAGKELGMEPVEDKTPYSTVPGTRGIQLYNSFKKAGRTDAGYGFGNARESIQSGSINITNSPQITIQGNADKKVVNNALSANNAEIMKLIKKVLKEMPQSAKRVSFNS